jgi:hypothetical protein
LTLFLILFFFWRRRRQQQFDGTFEPDRITQGGTGHTDITGTAITTHGYDPQAGAGAGIGHSGYDSELGVSHAGSGPSGPSTAIWSGESSMRPHPESPTLIMGNVSGMGGGVGTGTSGLRYRPTPSEGTSAGPESITTGRSNSYGSGSGSPSMGSTKQQAYRPFSVQEKGQSVMIEHMDSDDEGRAEVEEVGSLQRSDSGQGVPHPQPHPSAPAESPFVEVMTTPHPSVPAESPFVEVMTTPHPSVPAESPFVEVMTTSHPSVPAESPFDEVVTIQHTDGGRVPDVEAVASTPHEIPPSYDSIPGNV